MKIISHRGYWSDPSEKNTQEAFVRSFQEGFGTELDVRDCNRQLVVSHDMPTGDELLLAEVLDFLEGRNLPVAVNIKADGLAKPLLEIMSSYKSLDWFTFDMSIPETIVQLKLGLPVFTRASEHETPPPLYQSALGVWLDSFDGEWWTPSTAESFLHDGKRVCIVSPELHGRDHYPLWNRLASSGLTEHPELILCTDLPAEARQMFGAT